MARKPAQTPEEKKAKDKIYRETHKEQIAAQQKKYREDHPDKVAESAMKSRLKKIEPTKNALRNGESWTQYEEQFLFDHIETMTIVEIAEELNRTFDAVDTRKKQLLGARAETASKLRQKDRFVGKHELEAQAWSGSRKNSNL